MMMPFFYPPRTPLKIGSRTGTGYGRSRTGTSLIRKKSGGRGGGDYITQRIRSMETAQHSSGEVPRTVSQQVVYTLPLTSNIITTAAPNTKRTNDTIFLEAIKINYTYQTDVDRVNGQKFRLMVLYHDEFITGGTWTDGGLVAADMFLPGTPNAYFSNGLIDAKKVQVVYDQIHTLNASFASMIEFDSGYATIPLKKTFNYKSGTQDGKFKNLYAVCMGNVGGSVPGVIGQVNLSFDLIFKDCK